MQRKRLTITLKESLLKTVDQLVDGRTIRNRSHAIEYIIANHLPSPIKKALILAGGSPLPGSFSAPPLPKGMLTVNGRPVIETTIRRLAANGIEEIVISTGLGGDLIRRHLDDGRRFRVRIHYFRQSRRQGTAIPLSEAEAFLADTPFILWYGDVLADIDLERFGQFHRQHQGMVSVALTSVKDNSPWGVVRLQGTQIVHFAEKPLSQERSHVISAGIFICNPEIFQAFPSGARRLEQDVFPRLTAQGALYGYLFDGRWFDVGSSAAYARARKEFKT